MTLTTTSSIDRAAVLGRFRRMRARTRALFDLLDERVYYDRPIALRNPIVFYEGHLPAFAVNTLLKRGLGRAGVDPVLEEIFARGIDPETEAAAVARGNPAWPSRAAVRAFAAAADRAIESAIGSAELEVPGHPMLHRALALWTILEHEEMHQETLAYMWHEVPYALKQRASDNPQLPPSSSQVPTPDSQTSSAEENREQITIPAGVARLGTGDEEPFAWDNEVPAHEVHVPAFVVDVHDVTNAQFMAFVEAGGYGDERWWTAEDRAWLAAAGVSHPRFWERDGGRWYWRGMFERVELPQRWPVWVTWAEARAYARWRGMRLLTEAEFHRAAFGSPGGVEADLQVRGGERRYPWGDALGPWPAGNFDFVRWDPEPVGSHPEGASAFGIHDLVGNGWEWTTTPFGPFEGFAPMASYPEYSADFFDGDHFVMKGASPVTARELVRPGFRNWFRPRYPYVYATFRCAVSADGRP